jgi:flagellar protein FlbD
MIHLTRLNNRPLVVNADLIKFIENAPDTVITLLTGEKLVVRESLEQVLERIREFHLHSNRRIGPGIPADFGNPAANSTAPETSLEPGRPDEEKP